MHQRNVMKLNNEIRNSNPFRVPEGYFDTLAEKTMSAIRESETESSSEDNSVTGDAKAGRKISLRPYLALAAAIAGFALVTTLMVRLVRNDSAGTQQTEEYSLFADLAAEEIDIYMLENELRKTGQPGLSESFEEETLEQEISTEDIIDYLTREDIDINDIYELL